MIKVFYYHKCKAGKDGEFDYLTIIIIALHTEEAVLPPTASAVRI
jgi:hypothetical protein